MTRNTNIQDQAELVRQAQTGDLKAQLYLGWAYSKFGTLDHKPEAAEHWLRLAAAGKTIDAKRALARFLFDYNKQEATVAADDLIKLGDFYGHFLKGHIWAEGRCGATKDVAKAAAEFNAGAQLGHVISAIDGLRLEYGYPIFYPRNWPKLRKLIQTWLRIWRQDEKDWRISR